jgi:uncharacterized protein YjbJ (UPF0337 family)
MSSATSDRIRGAANEAIGKVKRRLGKALNNPSLKLMGDLQEAKGDALKMRAKVKARRGKSLEH